MPDLSLVIPVYNEARRLVASLDRLGAYSRQSGLALELVLADDGSGDDSLAVFDDWTRRQPFRTVTTRSVSIAHRGKGAAVRAGMALVTAEVVGYCDADLSAGPDAVEALLGTMQAGADMAMASRGLEGSVLAVRQPWYREAAGRTFNMCLRAITGLRFRDTQCGLKLFKADVARALFARQRLDGFAFDLELVMLAERLGYRVVEVPIRWSHADGSKVALGRDALRMARDAMTVVRRLRRGLTQVPGVPADSALEAMTQTEDSHWWHAAKRRLVMDELATGGHPERCLDLGCGGGAMVAEAARLGVAIGADTSPDALRAARQRGLTALVRADCSAVPFASGTFTSLLALDVIEHHARPELILSEIVRLLVPGGRLVVTVPAFQSMWSYADDALGHYRRYSVAQLHAELSQAGLVVEHVRYVHAWLLPLAWIYRRFGRLRRSAVGSDDHAGSPVLNRVFALCARLERRWFARRHLPFGLTVIGVASRRK